MGGREGRRHISSHSVYCLSTQLFPLPYKICLISCILFVIYMRNENREIRGREETIRDRAGRFKGKNGKGMNTVKVGYILGRNCLYKIQQGVK